MLGSQAFPERGQSATGVLTNRADRTPQRRCDLLLAQIGHVTEHYHLALTPREAAKGIQEVEVKFFG